MARFERRFSGKDNAGLRAEIRRVAVSHGPSTHTPKELERAILAIADRVALTASGKHTLGAVAADYRELAEAERGRVKRAGRRRIYLRDVGYSQPHSGLALPEYRWTEIEVERETPESWFGHPVQAGIHKLESPLEFPKYAWEEVPRG